MSSLQDNRFYRTLGAFSGAPPIPDASAVELSACYERIAELEAALTECQSYFEARSDVIDGDYGIPAPNAEMKMLQEIEGVLP